MCFSYICRKYPKKGSVKKPWPTLLAYMATTTKTKRAVHRELNTLENNKKKKMNNGNAYYAE